MQELSQREFESVSSRNKVYEPRTKVMMRARRAVMLDRPDDQPGYLIKCLETDTIKVTPHVRFCVDQRPGLSKSPLSGEPTLYALDVVWKDATLTRAVDQPDLEVSSGSGSELPPAGDAPDEGGEYEVEQTSDSPAIVGAGDDGHSNNDEGPPASRLNRARRRPVAHTQFDFELHVKKNVRACLSRSHARHGLLLVVRSIPICRILSRCVLSANHLGFHVAMGRYQQPWTRPIAPPSTLRGSCTSYTSTVASSLQKHHPGVAWAPASPCLGEKITHPSLTTRRLCNCVRRPAPNACTSTSAAHEMIQNRLLKRRPRCSHRLA